MELSAVAGFALIAVTLILVPGPDWAFVLASGVRDRVVGPAVLGLMLGYAAITAVVAVGVGPVLAA
jgi:threonine/homoserine/homoserine lactone efflux protein